MFVRQLNIMQNNIFLVVIDCHFSMEMCLQVSGHECWSTVDGLVPSGCSAFALFWREICCRAFKCFVMRNNRWTLSLNDCDDANWSESTTCTFLLEAWPNCFCRSRLYTGWHKMDSFYDLKFCNNQCVIRLCDISQVLNCRNTWKKFGYCFSLSCSE